MVKVITMGVTGALTHLATWSYLASGGAQHPILVALIGLLGSSLTTGGLIFAARIAARAERNTVETREELARVHTAVTSPRRISADREEGVRIEPPEVDN